MAAEGRLPVMFANIALLQALNAGKPPPEPREKAAKKIQGDPMKVWIYVDTSKQVGSPDYLKVFATPEAANKWLKEHDPEGVAFAYEVLE
jgi:hypothetical protein